jgi:hypothetical protein
MATYCGQRKKDGGVLTTVATAKITSALTVFTMCRDSRIQKVHLRCTCIKTKKVCVQWVTASIKIQRDKIQKHMKMFVPTPVIAASLAFSRLTTCSLLPPDRPITIGLLGRHTGQESAMVLRAILMRTSLGSAA